MQSLTRCLGLTPGAVLIRAIMHLTYRDSPAHTDMVSAPSAEAGAPDIIVTDRMVKAGVEAFLRFHPSEDDPEWIASGVFEAMFKLSPQKL